MGLLAFGSGLVCSAALAFGLGFVAPVNDVIGSLCDLIACGGMVFIGVFESV